MRRKTANKISVLLIIALMLTMLSSCTVFKRSAVALAATEFCTTLKTGKATDILHMTDGLEKDFKKSFRDLLNSDNYSEEENTFNEHMLASIKFEIDMSTVVINKDKAKVKIDFTIADHNALKGGDYATIDALAQAVDDAPEKDISVTAKLELIEKEWLITNFDDRDFQELFAFYNDMPGIGREALLATAERLAKAVMDDDYEATLALADPNIDYPMEAFLKDTFNVSDTPTKEDIALRDAIRTLITFIIDESSIEINGKFGSIDITVRMPEYEKLANEQIDSIENIANIVERCGFVDIDYTCTLVREGTTWYITNLTSQEFIDIMSYEKFSIDFRNIDGTYKANVDITDKFTAYVAKEYNVKMPSDLEGKIHISSSLTLKDGSYSVTIDRNSFVTGIQLFFEKNIDNIIANTLGTSSPGSLNTLAKIAGYKDYDDMKEQIKNQVMTTLQTIDTASLESSGTYTVDGDKITLISGTDRMTGTIDNFGAITITAPVSDADAQKLLGANTITMVYQKAG